MKLTGRSFEDIKIEFVYSPFFEMLCSLHVLFHPEHHKAREDWVKEMTGRIPARLYETLKFYDAVSYEWMGIMEMGHGVDSFDDFNPIHALRHIEGLPIQQFAYLALNKEVEAFDIKKMILLKKCHLDTLKQEQIEFLYEIETHKSNLVSTLKEYYYLFFYNELIELEPFLIKNLKAHQVLSEGMPFRQYLSIIHPRIEVRERGVSFHKFKRFDVEFKQLQLIQIGISSFIDPHLLIGFDDAYLQLTIRVNYETFKETVHEDLLKLLKAVSDRTRLMILKLLYDRAQSTQSLSECLDISEAAVSKHLKQLYQAEVVRKVRDGNYILYYLNTEMLDRIPMNLYQYFDEH